MQNWRVSDLDKIVGPIERERVPDETDVGCSRSSLKRGVVGADNGQGTAIGRPPSDHAGWSGETTRRFKLKSRERGAQQKKYADAPFPTDSFTAVYKAHPDTSRARKNIIKGFAF